MKEDWRQELSNLGLDEKTFADLKNLFDEADKQANSWETKLMQALIHFRTIRLQSGFSQEELSRRSHVPRSTIANIESGKRNATLKTLISLAEAMDKKLKIQLTDAD